MGERWQYSWVGELLSSVWWVIHLGGVLAIAFWVPWIAAQLISLVVLYILWGLGSHHIQRRLPFPDDKPEWPGCLLFIIGISAISAMTLGNK